MSKKLKVHHAAAIEYADTIVPNAKRLLESGADAPSIQRRWLEAFRAEMNRLSQENP